MNGSNGSMSSKAAAGVVLPETLRLQLRRFERRLFAMETLLAVLAGSTGVLLTYGVLFLLDRFWDTPAGIRALLSGTGGLTAGALALVWLRRWWWRRPDARALARIVRRRQPRTGERLLGAVELANGGGVPANVSAVLCRAAVEQVAREVAREDLGKTVSTRGVRRWLAPFAALAIVTAGLAAVFPGAARNALSRWMRPLAPVERYTFVRIEDLPGRLVMPHGEAFEIGCRLTAGSAWEPVEAVCRFERQPAIRARLEGGAAVFRVPGQTQPGILTVKLGDVRREIRVEPALRPELVALRAEAELPGYLEQPARALEVRGATVDVPRGSVIRLAGEASRELRAMTAEIRSPAGEGEAAPERTPTRAVVPVSGRGFATATTAVERVESYTLTWTDVLGLAGPAARTVRVNTIEDAAPAVDFPGAAPAVALLADEVLALEFTASDDHGLKDAWVTWGTEAGPKETEGAAGPRGSKPMGGGTPGPREISGTFSFCAALLQVPEETRVAIYGNALDHRPGRTPTVSAARRIYVLSRARHARLVQEMMQALQARLEDVARQEERLLDQNQELAGLAPKELESAQTGRKLEEHARGERRQGETVRELAKGAGELTREAMRNRDIPEEMLRQWEALSRELEESVAGQMGEAAQALQKAGKEGGSRGKDLEHAMALEKEIVKALRGAEKGMNDSIENLMAQSFVNRLRAAAGQEREIGGRLQAMLPSLVGLSAAALPAPEAAAVKGLAGRQDETGKALKYVQDDLAGFHRRTRLAVYGQVHAEMLETRLLEGLAGLAGRIRENLAVKAVEDARAWEQKLLEWAGRLEKEDKRKSEGEGEGEGEGEPPDRELMELLLALMRARQAEETLREQTRMLDEGKAANADYAAKAHELSRKQYELAGLVRPLERRTRLPEVRKLLDKINGEMMNAGLFLRRPQTDSATVAIETEIIEMLSQSMAKSAASGGAAAQAMMARMGMGMGRGGGGSMAGGTTARPNLRAVGDPAGDGAESRAVEKTGGADVSSWPEEFRDILDGYFRGLEEE